MTPDPLAPLRAACTCAPHHTCAACHAWAQTQSPGARRQVAARQERRQRLARETACLEALQAAHKAGEHAAWPRRAYARVWQRQYQAVQAAQRALATEETP